MLTDYCYYCKTYRGSTGCRCGNMKPEATMTEPTENQEIERAELESRQIVEAWYVDSWHGPRPAKLHRIFAGDHHKAVVEFAGGLHLVDTCDVFDTEKKAYQAAWLKSLEAAAKNMDKAKEYKAAGEKLK